VFCFYAGILEQMNDAAAAAAAAADNGADDVARWTVSCLGSVKQS